MAFTSITIKNFRGIQSLKVKDFGRVNVFVGKNSVGKSSVIEALFMTASPSNAATVLNLNAWRGMDASAMFGLHLFFHNFRYTGDDSQNFPHFVASLNENEETRHLTLLPINDYLISADHDFNAPPLSGLMQNFTIERAGGEAQNYQTETVIKSFSPPSMHPSPAKAYQEKIASYFISPRIAKLDAAILRDIIIKKREREIVQALKNIDERIEGIVLVQDALYCDIGLSELMPLTVMGDGIRKMLFILGAIATNSDGIVCIDEIENGFHYSSLAVLWNAVLQAAKEFNVQVFATTHSYECLAALAQAQETHLFDENVVRVFRLERDGGDRHSAVTIDDEALAAMIESNWEMR